MVYVMYGMAVLYQVNWVVNLEAGCDLFWRARLILGAQNNWTIVHYRSKSCNCARVHFISVSQLSKRAMFSTSLDTP